MATSHETIHQRPRSKFRLPPPIANNTLDSRSSSQATSASGTSAALLPPPIKNRFNAKDSGISTNSGNSNGNSCGNTAITSVLPGRPRRRQHSIALPNKSSKETQNYPTQSENDSKGHSPANQYNLPVPVAVLLWYLLGVVSISSSKILLSTYGVPPMVLTLQQLIIGMTLPRMLLVLGGKGGLQPIPMQSYSVVIEGCSSGDMCDIGVKRKSSKGHEIQDRGGILSSILAIPPGKLRSEQDNNNSPHIDLQLVCSAMYFTLGFLLTNYGFEAGSAAFVETIKAAEPITSASVAVAWGLERLGKEEICSLAGIVVGVILSTLGQKTSKVEVENQQSTSLVMSLVIVMISNICFSFRGLHQKLFRASPQGKASSFNDLNLQFRMQQIGVLMLAIPAMLTNTLWILRRPSLFDLGKIAQYLPLALANGIAFTSYNLASTYVLTRISVVHHAALNCIRRVFAVIVTSMVFGLSITALQVAGIATSVGGFFSFSHYKLKKGTKEKRRRELRKKYGVVASRKATSNKIESKGWTDEKKDADSAV
eukprot:scaffold50084_cov67-Cyclotella_meneghiniana.AAC.5